LLDGVLHRATQLGTSTNGTQTLYGSGYPLTLFGCGLINGVKRYQTGNGRAMTGDGNFFTVRYGCKQFRKPVFSFKYSDCFHGLIFGKLWIAIFLHKSLFYPTYKSQVPMLKAALGAKLIGI